MRQVRCGKPDRAGRKAHEKRRDRIPGQRDDDLENIVDVDDVGYALLSPQYLSGAYYQANIILCGIKSQRTEREHLEIIIKTGGWP